MHSRSRTRHSESLKKEEEGGGRVKSEDSDEGRLAGLSRCIQVCPAPVSTELRAREVQSSSSLPVREEEQRTGRSSAAKRQPWPCALSDGIVPSAALSFRIKWEYLRIGTR